MKSFSVSRQLLLLFILALTVLTSSHLNAAESRLKLKEGDHIAYIGNTTADRMQHHAWLETYIHALHPQLNLTFRNLGFPGDELKTRSRSDNFGSPDQWLTKVKADVVFCFFGYNEALRGEKELPQFKKNLNELIDQMRSQKYNGKSSPQLVFFSPIAHENLHSRHLPDGIKNNKNLKLYTDAMRDICKQKKTLFVDLFTPTQKLYATAKQPLTMNGIHLLDSGNDAVARLIVQELFVPNNSGLQGVHYIAKLRKVVLDKNYHWFSRYRVVDGYNVYGGRSKLAWFDQSNADVMMREMEIFDVKTANRDKRVWAVARGSDLKVTDDNLPKELDVKPNKIGPLKGGAFPYLGGKEAISKMTIHKGMEVNLFASEEKFPRLVNPVQMAVDTDGRLWASVWQSYPHWNPVETPKDALLIFPDENHDGEADECIVFADGLNSITSFEFWGGGVLVAAAPEIWFLKDTDGDNKADFKLRMLQGVSSADTHHSANAMLVGPDGWLYWSRGIFNTANFETPTKTFRSGSSGVHRFNPRTFEFEFHFPIGPNPHGDVFDQWGFQFANDGTGGTGSYVNIGKGIGNKKWFKKRVRPVAATGLLSSSHFPDELQGNFLICNTIGFLGVLQHEVKYNGADITATEIEPILYSDDPNFRPSDIEIGGDGALYVADWQNTLIGHMQHNMRDPNRDHIHGRIYRVTYKGRDLVYQPKMKGKPIAEVCKNFYAKENSTRYRARLELTGRDDDEIIDQVGQFASKLDINKPDDAQALLECLWVFEERRLPNEKILTELTRAAEPRVRAAAIRTLGHWGTQVKNWAKLLLAASKDDSAIVRAEAVKAAVAFDSVDAAHVIFEVTIRPMDSELATVLNYAKSQINVEHHLNQVINSGKPLSEAATAYALKYAEPAYLLKLPRNEAVYQAVLSRAVVPENVLKETLTEYAKLRQTSQLDLLLDLIAERDRKKEKSNIAHLGKLIAAQPQQELKKDLGRIEKLATRSKATQTRQAGYIAWIVADGSGKNAFFGASKDKQSLSDLLKAVPSIPSESLRETLYSDVRSLMFELPPNLKKESNPNAGKPGVLSDYYYPSAANVAIETLNKMKPVASTVLSEISMYVPAGKKKDRFANRFSAMIETPKRGKYTFYVTSDDGSRIYINGKLVVNNDGLHGMSEKKGTVSLSPGLHSIVLTYFDNGGGDGLKVHWSGPGFKKKKISADSLSIPGSESIHDIAIRSLASIPGHQSEKFADLSKLVKAGKNRKAAITVLQLIPENSWNKNDVRPLVDNLIEHLSSLSAKARTQKFALNTSKFARALASKLPAEQNTAIEKRLQNLDVRIIAIGTVPARMIYDKEQIIVQAGKPVEFRFSNSDHMPHNLAFVLPGALEEVGVLAENTARDPDAKARGYIPKSDKILLASKLLEPGQNQSLLFNVPKKLGIYPYVCTYPGHWRRMYGALYVVDNVEEYLKNPEEYAKAHSMEVKDELLKFVARNTEWKYDDLADAVKEMPAGRNYDLGKELFKFSNCLACHKMGTEGRELGPDLTKTEEKKNTLEHILLSLVNPSKEIDKKYQSNTFVLASGKVVTGMLLEENNDQVKLLVDPLAKADPLVIKKDDIDDRATSKVSIMPEALLNKLTKEEILDLIAYVHARGDKNHQLFKESK